jgi:hypothetical protein
MSSPTPTKDTIRSIDPTLDRSMKKSFSITAASNPDPANHTDRSSLRVANSIAASARQVQNIDRVVCAIVD